ncbi:SurA N-terminal domain-containing protein [Thalassotalea atypica]|uniref:SurA N-terminal domain-containing protein n=1 Tax=Thalassotalea atypica TaxID=2054316 RepID=UPI002573A51D|nr:SurA N-terminal domain-containing protein [Thalassotalea atypica]
MLENIRENSQGVIAKVILGFIILTFAVAGLGSYTNSVDTSVAEVNGAKISQADFEKSYQSQRNRMAQQFGEMFETIAADPNYMATFRTGVLDTLINELLMDQNADELAIRVSNEKIKETIRTMPEFQIDGVFDNNRYLAMINQAGFFQSSDFRDYLRVEMTRRQLSQSLVSSEFSLPYQLKQLNDLQNQTRDIRYATISAEQFKAQVEVTDEEIKSFYQANQARFQNDEKVKLEYVSLNVDDIAKTIIVSDKDIETYYQENMAAYRTDEQRRVAHILIEFGEDEDSAKATAESVLAKLNQGEDFAALAREFSADIASAEIDGDLDWIERGVMEPAFEEAAYALSGVGSHSELVESSFGFHIIKLTDFKAEEIQALADVKSELESNVSNEKAQDKFFELQQELARVSFEFPDSLEDAAEIVSSEVKVSDWIARAGNLPPFNNNKIIDAAFSDIVLVENLNSDIIEVNDSVVMVLRLAEHQEADVKPLEEVKAGIKANLVAEKASEKAKQSADELLALFIEGADVSTKLSEVNATITPQTGVTRNSADLDNSLVRQAFTLAHPTEGAVSAATVTLSNGDIAIVEVQAVNIIEGEPNPSLKQQQDAQISQASYKSYLDALKAKAKVTRRQTVEPATPY